MELTAPKFDAAEIVYTYFPPNGDERRGTLLIVHGKFVSKNFRFSLNGLARALTYVGFRVLVFDPRANLQGCEHHKYSIFDWIQEAGDAIDRMLTVGDPPFSILGMGKGAHVAIRAIAEAKRGNLIENVMLLQPRAYPRARTAQGVPFRKRAGEYRGSPGAHNNLRTSDAFEAASKVNANLLLMKYPNEVVFFQETAEYYYQYFGSEVPNFQKERILSNIPARLRIGINSPGPQEIQHIIAHISNFIAVH